LSYTISIIIYEPCSGLPLFLEIWKQGNVREFSNGQGNVREMGKNREKGKVRDFFCLEKMFLSISKSKNLPCLLKGCVVFNLLWCCKITGIVL
jgi:hypothetical protein